jgi:hypothetical protein
MLPFGYNSVLILAAKKYWYPIPAMAAMITIRANAFLIAGFILFVLCVVVSS